MFHLIGFVFFFSSCRDTDSRTDNRVLILSDEWPSMYRLAESINSDGSYMIDSSDQKHLPDNLDRYAFIFMYIHKTLENDVEDRLIAYANDGGRLIVLHHGVASAKMQNLLWLGFLGVELFSGDDPQYPWKVLADTTHIMVNLNPGHFITSNGMVYEKTIDFKSDYPQAPEGTYPAFDLPGTEIFLNQRFTKDSERTILFGVATENGDIMQPTSGWYRKTAKGWLFYYQAGHRAEDFVNKNFSQAIRNTMDWVPGLAVTP